MISLATTGRDWSRRVQYVAASIVIRRSGMQQVGHLCLAYARSIPTNDLVRDRSIR